MIDIQAIMQEKRGLRAEIARELKCSHAAIRQWEKVPPARVVRVSEIMGIPPHILRPDIFPAPSQETGKGG